ncbi:hypothetical protein HBH56_074170 [Parastagonospora nodorum]|uniref:Uncharacterized protein n=1 Tax=Phaeosphaeria nodorum (strain SN15 / ATCC MYA-4574 / FGSC 10173) TaxID=321614 RepID=A0A7U2IBI7_PHANO|nr:hypothetical protein HBH56_074170 [Parastagonospora nodorum]QRD06753.1 hypothetical protein JI435_423650 [Parastagonospora nodorum SN15]KAH3927368.1 hypothetical protein HBH54_154410 [Parastagonospora nodorum]KAH3981893.1 hypothetical protein HBH51_041170 [Parastagonospora nodorum]KAH3994794.1 hypothetical protein HBI10_181060 [Parastagonospora nodorum]
MFKGEELARRQALQCHEVRTTKLLAFIQEAGDRKRHEARTTWHQTQGYFCFDSLKQILSRCLVQG